MKAIIGIIVSWAIAGVIFWLCFFVAAGFLIGIIPESSWSGIINVVIYLVIAGMGGIAFPLIIGIYGTVASLGFWVHE